MLIIAGALLQTFIKSVKFQAIRKTDWFCFILMACKYLTDLILAGLLLANFV